LSPEASCGKACAGHGKIMQNEGIPLIVSIANGADVEEWVTDAKRFEQAGADMLELNFSCPLASDQMDDSVGKVLGQNIPLATEIIKSIKRAGQDSYKP